MLEKTPRWENKKYLDWVATLPCSHCGVEDETIVAHHLKHRYAPWSGGIAYKASDWLTMPLCYACHNKLHNGSRWLREYQPFMILKTLDMAFRDGIMVCKIPKIGEDLSD